MDKQRAKKLLGIPTDIHVSDVPKELSSNNKLLLCGIKKEWKDSYEDSTYAVHLRVREDKFVFKKYDWLSDKDIEEEILILKAGFLDSFFDLLSIEDCDESFLIFLIDCGYKEILKKKVLE